MKLWADWLADNPRGHARCPGLTFYNVLKRFLEFQDILSRFEALLPYEQPRLTFGETRLPIPH